MHVFKTKRHLILSKNRDGLYQYTEIWSIISLIKYLKASKLKGQKKNIGQDIF